MSAGPVTSSGLRQEDEVRWRLGPTDGMRVPGVVFATSELMEQIHQDEASLGQVANVAHLPGIVEASYGMPDLHRGYGFPIGGVAATDVDDGGVVSPAGVGFDISCGVRLHTAPMSFDELGSERLNEIMDVLDARIPRGLGEGAVWDLSRRETMNGVLAGGARYAIERGRGVEADLDRIEEGGAVDSADPDLVSDRAKDRGSAQVGSLGGGNHFLELQVVDAVVDPPTARAYGLEEGQVCVMIHTGSRGLGHQICKDQVDGMKATMHGLGIDVPDRELACVPVDSRPGQEYLAAMGAGANFGRANRQILGEATRDAFGAVAGTRELPLVYDVSHNMARLEDHEIDGRTRRLCVHRKGAILALPPRHPGLPQDFREAGQPLLIPGSMGTGSYVLAGVEGGPAFNSACHGAGRVMSRTQAKKRQRGHEVRTELEEAGIAVRPGSEGDLAEEAPYAYKDIDAVVETCERAGLARRVARLRPLGVVKG
ncbi:MAG: RtcB family protein [Nitriliruptorales bacterium]|nr:RtcB family protein [Nitriliruptorales bacterium]